MYFGTLAMGRFALLLVGAFAGPMVDPNLRPHPVNASNLCGRVKDFRFKSIPNYIGTGFGMWLHACVDCHS